MPTLFKRNADIVVTMGDESCELLDAGLFVRDGVIEQVGPTEELPWDASVVLSMMGQMFMRGFVNNGKAHATEACMPTPAHSGRQGFSLRAGSPWKHSRGPPANSRDRVTRTLEYAYPYRCAEFRSIASC